MADNLIGFQFYSGQHDTGCSTLLSAEAGQDAWISVLIAGVMGVLIGVLVVSLGLRFPKRIWWSTVLTCLAPGLDG